MTAATLLLGHTRLLGDRTFLVIFDLLFNLFSPNPIIYLDRQSTVLGQYIWQEQSQLCLLESHLFSKSANQLVVNCIQSRLLHLRLSKKRSEARLRSAEDPSLERGNFSVLPKFFHGSELQINHHVKDS